MFRGVYWKIASMLMASTILLLLLIGGGVYFLLKHQLRHDSVEKVEGEAPEIRELVHSVRLHDLGGKVARFSLDDDNGEHLYFLATVRNKTIAASNVLPAPNGQLEASLKQATARGENPIVLNFNGKPYLAYVNNWTDRGDDVTVTILTSIYAQQDMLQKDLRFMLIAGGVGILLAIGFNLYLGQRALRPAVAMYNAQQELMTELSHEMQTPLATLNALSVQISEDAVRRRMQDEILHASDLVQDILYLSKLRSLPGDEREPVAVSDITEEVAERLSTLAARNGITLMGKVEQGLFVEANPDYWNRMVSTLFKNVVDHAASPSEATWYLRQVDDNIHLVVENAVAEDPSPANGDKPQFKGFGIAILNRLAETMEGQLELRQEGSIFVAKLVVPALLAPSD